MAVKAKLGSLSQYSVQCVWQVITAHSCVRAGGRPPQPAVSSYLRQMNTDRFKKVQKRCTCQEVFFQGVCASCQEISTNFHTCKIQDSLPNDVDQKQVSVESSAGGRTIYVARKITLFLEFPSLKGELLISVAG